MDYLFPFEKLEVWHLAKDFVKDIYLTIKTFPTEERYGLSSQITRAAISIVSNIAEGSSRKSKRDEAHFYQLAFSSLMEVTAQLIISRELGYISDECLNNLRDKIHELSNKLNALYNFKLKYLSTSTVPQFPTSTSSPESTSTVPQFPTSTGISR
jgi:four helix bundle protein